MAKALKMTKNIIFGIYEKIIPFLTKNLPGCYNQNQLM